MEQNGNNVVEFDGVLEDFWETGTEGVYWTLYEDGKTGYDGFKDIMNGDHLIVWNEDGSIAFDDIIVVDRKSNYHPYPMNPKYGQQVSCGMWVHWLQKGMDPDAWGELFFHHPRLRARIIRKRT